MLVVRIGARVGAPFPSGRAADRGVVRNSPVPDDVFDARVLARAQLLRQCARVAAARGIVGDVERGDDAHAPLPHPGIVIGRARLVGGIPDPAVRALAALGRQGVDLVAQDVERLGNAHGAAGCLRTDVLARAQAEIPPRVEVAEGAFAPLRLCLPRRMLAATGSRREPPQGASTTVIGVGARKARLEEVIADLQPLAFAPGAGCDATAAVDQAAVGGVEIGEGDLALLDLEARVRARHPLVVEHDGVVGVASDGHLAADREGRGAAAAALRLRTLLPGDENAAFGCTAGGGYAEGLVDEVAEAPGRPRVAGVQGMQLVEPALDVSDRAAAIDEHDLAAMLLRQLAQHAVVAVDHDLEDGVLHGVGDLLRQQRR